jgi:tetratricopeptide (TPR) repeat protein
MRARCGAAGIAAILATSAVGALFLQVEVRQIPVARLLANLEGELKADPANPDREINLARLYGMAYALRSDRVPATDQLTPAGKEQPWYGHTPDLIPYKAQRLAGDDPVARENLRQAAAHYEAALKLDPSNLLAHLGHAWTLDQSGRAAEAIAEYRQVVEQAWTKEQSAKYGSFKPFFTAEAAGYLIALLDPAKDAAEIAQLRERVSKLGAMPRPITPIAIPLENMLAPTAILDADARVRFDADGTGWRREWTWISPRAGWLVYDADGSGRITSALQWFGNVTFWLFWPQGYEALATLDDNHDGELAGGELAHLAVWRDANANGISEPGEVLPLSAHGIVALSCAFSPGDGATFAAVSQGGVRFANGATRPTYDVMLHPRGTSHTH